MGIMFTKQNQYISPTLSCFLMDSVIFFFIFLHFKAILLTAKKLFTKSKPKILFLTVHISVMQKAITRWRKSPVWKHKKHEKGLCGMPPINPTEWLVSEMYFEEVMYNTTTLFLYVQLVIWDSFVQMVKWVLWGSSLLPLSRHWCVRFGLIYISGRMSWYICWKAMKDIFLWNIFISSLRIFWGSWKQDPQKIVIYFYNLCSGKKEYAA